MSKVLIIGAAIFSAQVAHAQLHGCVSPLERISAEHARGDESARAWHGVAWRNERIHAAFAIWGADTNANIRAEADALVGPGGARLAVRIRWVRETLASDFFGGFH